MRSFEVPALVSVADAATVQGLFQSRTLPDALGELPGVAVQKTAYGQGSPYIRGYTGFRNVMLVEGIRLNNSVFRDGPEPVLEHRGPVLHGPRRGGARAGLGALRQRRGRRRGQRACPISRRGRPASRPGRLYRYSSAENSNVARAEAGWKGDGLRALGGYTYKDFGDLEGGGDVGVQRKTGYGENAADVRIEYDVGDATTLIAGYQFVDQDEAWRTHRTIYGLSWRGHDGRQ
jgi:hemoglobin/transferrin/lactoferrin receptor protein